MSHSRTSFDNVVPLPDGVEDNPWERFVSLARFINRRENLIKIGIDGKFCENTLANGGYITVSLQLTNRHCNLRCKNLNSEAIKPSEWSRIFKYLPNLDMLVMRNVSEEALLHAVRHCKELRRLVVKSLVLLEHTLDELMDFPNLQVCAFCDLEIGYTSPQSTLLELEKLQLLFIRLRDMPEHPLIRNLALTIIAPELDQEKMQLSEPLRPFVYIDNCVAYDPDNPMRPEE